MKKLFPILLISIFSINSVVALDMGGINIINPLESNKNTFTQNVNAPSQEAKKATLTKNSIDNQYSIAMDKFIKSNIRSSYNDFKILIDNVTPNDYTYMKLSREMAEIGFFNLSELAMAKIQDDELAGLMEEDVKTFYYPSYKLTHKDQIYLAEIYSNIMYNDQSKEATDELMKHTTMLMESDYANYIAAFGNMKNGNIEQAQKSISNAISKNPKNINYKRLRAEILSQFKNPNEGLKSLKSLNNEHMNTIIFDKELHSTNEYILYKTANNDYLKKYHLAYYYYDKNELNKALRTLQTAVSGKKNINKDVFALTSKVYYDMQEYEKSSDYAQKAVDIDKNNVTALTVLGDVAFRNKDYIQAQSYYKKASAKDNLHNAEIKLAKTYQKLNKNDKAKEIYTKILKSSSKTYEAYYEMALLEPDREMKYLKKAVSINPEFKDAWIDLARINISKEDYENALYYLGIAKYIDDNDDRYYYYLGLILKNEGLKSEAKSNFEKSLKLNPENSLAKKELNI